MQELLLETIPRIVLGLLFLVGVIDGYWFVFTGKNLVNPPTSARGAQFEQALKSTGFFWPFMKTVDLVAVFCLFTNLAPAFGLALLAPIMSVIVLYQFFLNPKGIPIALLIIVCGGLLLYSYADRYAALFR